MKYIIIAIAVLIGWTLFWKLPVNGLHISTGNGTQVGYVSAVEKSGLFFKTGRVYVKPDLSSTQEDLYCVVDDVIYSSLEEAAKNKTRVELKHQSWFINGMRFCNAEPAVIVGGSMEVK